MKDDNIEYLDTTESQGNNSTKKAVDAAAKGAALYFGGEAGAKALDVAKSVPVAGNTIDKLENKAAEGLNKVPGVENVTKAMDQSGVTDAVNTGLNLATGSNKFMNNKEGVKNSVPLNGFRKNNSFSNRISSDNINGSEENELKTEQENENGQDNLPRNDLNDNSVNLEDSANDNITNNNDRNKKSFFKNPTVIIALGIGGIFLFLIFLLLLAGGGINRNNGMYANYNSMCSTGSDGNLVSFLIGWEGLSGAECTINGLKGNRGIDEGDKTVTVGHGVTNHLLSSITDFIESNHYTGYFNRSDKGYYYMNVGDCIPYDVMVELKEYAIEIDYAATIDAEASKLGIELTQYQKDALTSFNYNLGSNYTSKLLSAYQTDGYEGLWDVMKDYVHSNGEELVGLKRRRKGEFALFVTGDYSDKGLFYSEERTLENYDYYDSEGVMARENICASLSENGLVAYGNYLARLTRPLRTNEIYYSQDVNNYAYTNYEGECSWYAGHRAKEILINSGSSKSWSSMPNGGSYCGTSEVSSGLFKSSKNINQPMPGALISWSNGSKAGHVAVVEEVYSDGSIKISEAYVVLGAYGQSAKDILWNNTAESQQKSKRKYNCEGNGSGCFQTRILTKDQIKNAAWGGNYNFSCYIYINESDERVDI